MCSLMSYRTSAATDPYGTAKVAWIRNFNVGVILVNSDSSKVQNSVGDACILRFQKQPCSRNPIRLSKSVFADVDGLPNSPGHRRKASFNFPQFSTFLQSDIGLGHSLWSNSPKTLIFGGKYLVFVSSRSVKMRDYLSQFEYFLRKVCLFFNFWMIECTIKFCLTHLCILSFKNWKNNTLSSKLRKLRIAKRILTNQVIWRVGHIWIFRIVFNL